MPNIRTTDLYGEDGYRQARLAEQAGAEHLVNLDDAVGGYGGGKPDAG